MVLEAFAALSLASSVVQFVDFGSKLLSKTKQLHTSKSGATNDNIDLDVIANSLQSLCRELTLSTSNDKTIQALADRCHEMAEELQGCLQTLKTQGFQSKFKSFKQALKVVWKESAIEAMVKRMESLREQLVFTLLNTLNDKQSEIMSTLNRISTAAQEMTTNTDQQLTRMKSDILHLLQDMQASGGDKNLSFNIPLQLTSNLNRWVLEGNRLATEQRILESLRFETIDVRHNQIPWAHARTFEWIYRSNGLGSERIPRYKFMQWLENENGIYWIAGKAGSGKSTLMKFLSDDYGTLAPLQKWAGSKKLILASFYFWSAGTEKQKSQDGLLQSLVYEIFRKEPKLIPVLASKRWKDPIFEGSRSWGRGELKIVCKRLQTQTEIPVRCCFFVDGLDEYDGDCDELIDIMSSFTQSPNIKVCLSSRPWNAFQAAFGTSQNHHLLLEELTRGDIELFVKSKLEAHGIFQQLKSQDSRYQVLVNEVVNKAQGVFLWVHLVVRSLLSGLSNADTVAELQKRLKLIPADLDKLFTKMLETTDEIYREPAAKTFLTAVYVNEPLSLTTHSFLDEDEEANEESVTARALDNDEIWFRLNRMWKRLNARCNGLLELTSSDAYPGGTHALEIKDPVRPKYCSDLYMTVKVDFLHRTVRDFLARESTKAMLFEHVARGYHPSPSLCKAYLAQLKSLPMNVGLKQVRAVIKEELASWVVFFAKEAELYGQGPQTEQLNDFCRVLSTKDEQPLRPFGKEASVKWCPTEASFMGLLKTDFLAAIVSCKLHQYVGQQLSAKVSLRYSIPEILHYATKKSPLEVFHQIHKGVGQELSKKPLPPLNSGTAIVVSFNQPGARSGLNANARLTQQGLEMVHLLSRYVPRNQYKNLLQSSNGQESAWKTLIMWLSDAQFSNCAELKYVPEVLNFLLEIDIERVNPLGLGRGSAKWVVDILENILGGFGGESLPVDWIYRFCEHFLTRGHDPNQSYGLDPPKTAWSLVLQKAYFGSQIPADQHKNILNYDIAELFLKHGAEKKLLVYPYTEDYTSTGCLVNLEIVLNASLSASEVELLDKSYSVKSLSAPISHRRRMI